MGAEKATGKQLPLQILNSIIFEATEKNLFIRATNLDLYIEYIIPAHIKEKGLVAIPAKVILPIIYNLPDQTKINLELIGNSVHFSTNGIHLTIKTTPPEDFPQFPNNKNFKPNLSISSSLFLDGLKTVAFAAATSDIKPEVASIYFFKDEDELIFVATDTFRLAEKRIDIKKINIKEKNFPPAIIPIKNVSEIIKTLEQNIDTLNISINPHQMIINGSNIFLLSRLIDGSFPDVSQVFPRKVNTEINVLKRELVAALKLNAVFTDKFNRIGIKTFSGDKHFEIYSRNQDTGEGVNRLDASIEGEDVDIQFNGRYILDCISSISDESITLRLAGKDKPLVISGTGNPTFTYLVMPLHG